MTGSITLGQYLPGKSILHNLNPRIKILALFLLLALLFSLKTFIGLLFLFVSIVTLMVIARVPLPYFFRGLRPIFYIVIFALIVYLFFTKGGVVLFRLGFITIESDGVREGFFVVSRLILLVLFSLLLTLTTTPLSLTHAMGYFLKPFRYLGLPTEEIAMVMAIALRFIPTLMEESQRLMRAQVARGADLEGGSLVRKAGNMVPLITPLFVSAFRRADELALAMEARGYRLGAKRTRLHEDIIRLRDWVALVVVVLTTGAVIFFGL